MQWCCLCHVRASFAFEQKLWLYYRQRSINDSHICERRDERQNHMVLRKRVECFAATMPCLSWAEWAELCLYSINLESPQSAHAKQFTRFVNIFFALKEIKSENNNNNGGSFTNTRNGYLRLLMGCTCCWRVASSSSPVKRLRWQRPVTPTQIPRWDVSCYGANVIDGDGKLKILRKSSSRKAPFEWKLPAFRRQMKKSVK